MPKSFYGELYANQQLAQREYQTAANRHSTLEVHDQHCQRQQQPPEDAVAEVAGVEGPQGQQEPSGQEGEPDKLLQTVRATRKERDRIKHELDELRGQFKALEGLDPDKYKAMQEEIESAKRQREQLTELEHRLQQEKEQEVRKYAEESTQLKQQLEQLKLDRLISEAYTTAGGRTEEQDGVAFNKLYLDQNRHRFARDKSGQLVVLDEKGAPLLDEANGKRVSPVEFIEMAHKRHKVFGAFFKSKKGSGYGDYPNTAGQNEFPTDDLSNLSLEEVWASW